MSPDQLVLALHDYLEPWVAEQKARLSLAGDPAQVLDLLLDGPQTWRVILAWEGEEPINEYDYAGIVTHTVEVYTAFHMGLPSQPGKELFVTRTGQDPLTKLHSRVVHKVREQVLPDNQQTARVWNYRGTQTVVLPSGFPTAAYRARFRMEAALPDLNP